MPLELGMTITWESLNPDSHTWFVWESEPYRLLRSTSDLNGTDPTIHFGSVEGLLSGLRNTFWFDRAPGVSTMLEIHRGVELNLDAILARNGTKDLYSPGVFRELCWLTSCLSRMINPQYGAEA
jgi:hypothetical protein